MKKIVGKCKARDLAEVITEAWVKYEKLQTAEQAQEKRETQQGRY